MRKLKNEELDRLTKDEFKSAAKMPVIVLLDNVRSMNNVGSAFRTGDAFLIEKIILTGITAQPPHREIHKTALGATESVDWQYYSTTAQAVTDIKAQGYVLVAIEQADESISLLDFTPIPDKKYCLVFGNEVMGVEEEIVKAADFCIEIPQHGTKHSLNISVSIGVILWDWLAKTVKNKS
jgi:tRNA G18 (ribose-2'-O)-methylase SpoU